MTERVIITGHDLDVEHHTDDDRARLQAKRARFLTQTDRSLTQGHTIEHLIDTPNPYWTDEANTWAEAHPEVSPKTTAKKWRKHRIES